MSGAAGAARRARLRHRRQAAAALLALLPLAAAAYVLTAPPGPDPHAGIPEYARDVPRIAEAYHYAATDAGAAALQWMACYCGCGGHSGHESNLACFIDGGGFDEHGANCGVCVDIALTTKRMLASGRPLSEIRATVDQRYAGAIGTETPLPP